MSSAVQRLRPLAAHREFRLVFGANLVSLIGDQIVPVALAFAVLTTTHSAADLGLVLLARTLPMVAFVLTGGVWADRLPRQALMVSVDLVRATSQGIFAALLLTGHATLAAMVCLQAIHGAATAFYRPAWSGLLPSLLPADLRPQGTGLLYTVSSGANVVGPAAAGLLIAVGGTGWALAVDALSFLVSAALLARVTVAPPKAPRPKQPFVKDLADGWGEVRGRRWLWVWIANFSAFQFLVLATFSVLGPVVSQDSLGGAGAWATISLASGLGSVLGGVVAVRWRPRRPLLTMTVVLLGAPAVLFGLAVPVTLAVLAGLAVLYGLAITFVGAVWDVTVQNHVPEHVLSRVVAYDWLGSSILRPLGLAVIGPLAAVSGVRAALLVTGAGYLAAVALAAAVPETWSLPSHPVGPEDLAPVG